MPPKRQTIQRTVEEDEDGGESRADQEEAGSVATTSMMRTQWGENGSAQEDVESFIQSQPSRESYLEKKAQRQEHKWRTIQHQFGQLQTEVRRENGKSGKHWEVWQCNFPLRLPYTT